MTELVLFGVTTGRSEGFDWLFREDLGAFFPHAWEERRRVIPDIEPDDDIVEAFYRWLRSPDLVVRENAAQAWCLWESATPEWPRLTQGMSAYERGGRLRGAQSTR